MSTHTASSQKLRYNVFSISQSRYDIENCMLCTSKGIAVKYTPTAVTRNLRTLGEHASIQRKLLSLTVNDVAQRAGVSATTVVNLEHGKPVRTNSLFAVLGILQLAKPAIDATDPYHTDLGALRAAEQLPKRVRNRS